MDPLCTSGLSISYIAVITTYLLTVHIKESLLRYIYTLQCKHVGTMSVLQLLSLRGKREVLIDKIQLVVTENHGGAVTPPAHGYEDRLQPLHY